MNRSCSWCAVVLVLVLGSAGDAAEPVGPRPAWNTSKLKGAPTPPAPYRVQLAFPQVKFERPTSVEEIPGEQRLLVTEMSGRILSLAKNKAVQAAELVANLDDVVGADVSLFAAASRHPECRNGAA